jgi:uncharacterized protein (DUF302 family)
MSKWTTFFLSILTVIFLNGCQSTAPDRLYERISPYPFEDTLLNLDIAISEYNYRIIHRSHIGQAVRDRGDENFPLSTITSFCNITYAKEMILINPQLINEMPCNIAVRETTSKQVIISTKLMDETVDSPSERAFAEKINLNLRHIIDATIE